MSSAAHASTRLPRSRPSAASTVAKGNAGVAWPGDRCRPGRTPVLGGRTIRGGRQPDNLEPHVTTGLAPREYLDKMLAGPFEAFTFSPVGAAVYHLGHSGTAAKVTQGMRFAALRRLSQTAGRVKQHPKFASSHEQSSRRRIAHREERHEAITADRCAGLSACRRCAGRGQAEHHSHFVRRFRVWRLGSLWWRPGARHADTQPRSAGERGDDVLVLLRTAELHPGSCGRADRALSES